LDWTGWEQVHVRELKINDLARVFWTKWSGEERNIIDVNRTSQLNHLTVEARSGRSHLQCQLLTKVCSHISYPINSLFGVNVEQNVVPWHLVQIHFSLSSKTKAERRIDTKTKNTVLLDVTSYSLVANYVYKGFGRTNCLLLSRIWYGSMKNLSCGFHNGGY
jgi:hypothetical protein